MAGGAIPPLAMREDRGQIVDGIIISTPNRSKSTSTISMTEMIRSTALEPATMGAYADHGWCPPGVDPVEVRVDDPPERASSQG